MYIYTYTHVKYESNIYTFNCLIQRAQYMDMMYINFHTLNYAHLIIKNKFHVIISLEEVHVRLLQKHRPRRECETG